MISVIIPVYNAEKTLRRCVDSVLGQTCSDLEAVLVDDGATDRSGSIVDEYARKDERVKAVHQEKRGLSCARNSGLDRASGAYIAFADADDWLETDALGTALAALTAYLKENTEAEDDVLIIGNSSWYYLRRRTEGGPGWAALCPDPEQYGVGQAVPRRAFQRTPLSGRILL